jgi:UDP-N-acetylmuramate dehydrogenase
MKLKENVSLTSLTTMRAGGPARIVALCESDSDVTAALAVAAEHHLPWYVLGSGSNVLASDEGYDGVLIRLISDHIEIREEQNVTTLIADAGVEWDDLITTAASHGLWGIENLAGIPGTVGAAPVQNIGAYGKEAKDTIAFVEVIDTATGSSNRLPASECAFGYRDSRFKHAPQLVITRVGFSLTRKGVADTAYADLTAAKDAGADLSTPQAVGDAVRAIRARKFPDLSLHGTAGSFFKNPVVRHEAYGILSEKYPGIPGFRVPGGMKVPLAFILDKVLGLRGFRIGNAWLYDKQPLVMVLDAGGTAHEVNVLAGLVTEKVFDATGIQIEREVRMLT